jgi:hypothetical protein
MDRARSSICRWCSGLHQLGHQRHIRQLRLLLLGKLEQDVDLLVANPIGSGADDRRPRPIAAALHLAALERQDNVVAARIATDLPELGAEQAVQQIRVIDRRRSEHDLAGHELVERIDAAGVPGHAGAGVDVGAADPIELGGHELRGRIAPDRVHGHGAIERPDGGAVLGQ